MPNEQVLHLRVAACGRDRVAAFPLPAGWRVRVCRPEGAPALSDAQVRRALARPLGGDRIARVARGARSAVILVDDFRRPTPVGRLCVAVLAELEHAGVARERVTVITGCGAHRAQPRQERRRLGAVLDDVGDWLIHDAFSPDVEYCGLTAAGTPVLVNAVAAAADFSVAISTVYPHPYTTWGGGAKMVLPGISHVSSIHHHHGRVKGGPRAGAPGRCPARRDLEDAAALFGLDVALCAVPNADKALCGLFVGDPTRAHRRAVAFARRAGRTELDGARPDLVIANAYPIDGDPTQLSKSQWPAQHFDVPTVQIFDFADVSAYHGLYHGAFRAFQARQRQVQCVEDPVKLKTAKMVLYSPQYGRGYVPVSHAWQHTGDWSQLTAAWAAQFPRASVAVFPAAPIQVPAGAR